MKHDSLTRRTILDRWGYWDGDCPDSGLVGSGPLTGRIADATGLSQQAAEPEEVSALRASISCARKFKTRPTGWSVRKWKNYKYRNAFRERGQRLFVVICEGGGLPTVVHTDRDKAVKEAYRLAHFNRGLRFHILASVDAFAKPAASGMEAATAGETPKSGSAEGDSPTAESGDAQ